MQITDTSVAAGEAIRPTAGALREQIHAHLALVKGATCDEVEVALTMRHQTASARIRELKLEDLIQDSGDRRPTRSGKLAIVWVVR